MNRTHADNSKRSSLKDSSTLRCFVPLLFDSVKNLPTRNILKHPGTFPKKGKKNHILRWVFTQYTHREKRSKLHFVLQEEQWSLCLLEELNNLTLAYL